MLLGSGLAVAVIAAIELALHLYADRKYGYFVDELYYLDCARHLAWGYVDQPPLIAAVAWLEDLALPARLVREDGSVEVTAGWPHGPGPAPPAPAPGT